MLAGRAVMINWSDVAPENRPAYYESTVASTCQGASEFPDFSEGDDLRRPVQDAIF